MQLLNTEVCPSRE